MDFKTQLFGCISLSVIGIYLIFLGYKTVILKDRILIFTMNFEIWLHKSIYGEEAAEKLKSKRLEPKSLLYYGIGYFINGIISLLCGILLGVGGK
jgi:hypothetical protein